jgi:hypothetical protein
LPRSPRRRIDESEDLLWYKRADQRPCVNCVPRQFDSGPGMDRTSAGSFRVVGRGMSPKRTWTGSRDVWQTPGLGRV